MYNNFFGFKEKPFKLAPDPENIFLGKSHEDALAQLLFSISHGKDCVSITGELGTGKTTLCRAFMGNLGATVNTAYISTPKPDALQLLKAINYAFSIDSTPDNTKDLIDALYRFLIEKKDPGHKNLVIIDEAHELPFEALEQVLQLSKLKTTQGNLLQIILAGQPELEDMLASD
ncbi:MAG: AAA family ATPase, partial [Desulfobulbales bacterium]|nr:AAA family ATPase [Desulfobulbales bacterium]